jgi:hypothetical protein
MASLDGTKQALAETPGVVKRAEGLVCTLCRVPADQKHVNSPEHKAEHQRTFAVLGDIMDRQQRRKTQQKQEDAAAWNPAADDDAEISMEEKHRLCVEAWQAGFAEGLKEGKRRFGAGAKDGDAATFERIENSQT